jgi:hypothetical protein
MRKYWAVWTEDKVTGLLIDRVYPKTSKDSRSRKAAYAYLQAHSTAEKPLVVVWSSQKEE